MRLNGEGSFGILGFILGTVYAVSYALQKGLTPSLELWLFLILIGISLFGLFDDLKLNEHVLKTLLGIFGLMEQ